MPDAPAPWQLFVQPDQRSCGAAAMVVARFLGDPEYRQLLEGGSLISPRTLAGDTALRERFKTETLAMHTDALAPGARVLVVDDVLATGGTLAATAQLVRRLGAEVTSVAAVLELGFLDGRARLQRAGLTDVRALVSTGGA